MILLQTILVGCTGHPPSQEFCMYMILIGVGNREALAVGASIGPPIFGWLVNVPDLLSDL